MKTQDIPIAQEIIHQWQGIVDLIAELVSVPAALIMKVEPPELTVFVSSESEGNPYERGEKAALNTGLYCETVTATRNRLLVPDATKDEEWKFNPDIKLGMISYLGFPVTWPNGDIFGTICVLDEKENAYSDLYQRLLMQFRDVVESDLRYLFDSAERWEQEERVKEQLKRSSEKSRRLLEEADRSRKALLSLLEDEKRTEEALRKSEEKYRTLFEESNDAIYITTREGKIVDINQYGLDLFGFSREDMQEINVEELYVSPADREKFQKEIEKTGAVREFELKLRKKDDTEMDCLLTATTRRGDDGSIEGYQGIIRDITERKRAEEELKKKMEQLDRANRFMVGRELRMIELKREINALLEKSGLPKKYTAPEQIGRPLKDVE